MKVVLFWMFTKELCDAFHAIGGVKIQKILAEPISACSFPVSELSDLQVWADGERVDTIIVIFIDRIAKLATRVSKRLFNGKEPVIRRLLIRMLNRNVLHELIHLLGDERDELRVIGAVNALVCSESKRSYEAPRLP